MNKDKINFSIIDHCSHDCDMPIGVEVKVSGKDYVQFGDNNTFPQLVQDVVEDCSTLGTVVTMVSTYVAGAGVDNDKEVCKDGTLLSELMQRLVYDYIAYGAAAVQLLRNPYGEIVHIEYVSVENCRLDEDGEFVYYAEKWGSYNRNIKKYARWHKDKIVANSIMYIKNPQSKGVYGRPLWSSAMRDALTMIEASKANYNSVVNQFQPNVLLSMNQGIPDPDTKDELERALLKKYSGSNGAKIMVVWSDSQDTAPTLQSFTADDYTAKYEAVMATCRQNILCSMRVSEQLVGISSQATGFSNIEYEASYKLLYATQIRPIQDLFEKAFKKIGIDFKFNEFVITFNND